MDHYDVTIEVEPLTPELVERAKSAGLTVFRGPSTWRVELASQSLYGSSVRAQARALVLGVTRELALPLPGGDLRFSIRNSDPEAEQYLAAHVLEDARRAYDPDPLERPKRRWYQRAMELGLGERKG